MSCVLVRQKVTASLQCMIYVLQWEREKKKEKKKEQIPQFKLIWIFKGIGYISLEINNKVNKQFHWQKGWVVVYLFIFWVQVKKWEFESELMQVGTTRGVLWEWGSLKDAWHAKVIKLKMYHLTYL